MEKFEVRFFICFLKNQILLQSSNNELLCDLLYFWKNWAVYSSHCSPTLTFVDWNDLSCSCLGFVEMRTKCCWRKTIGQSSELRWVGFSFCTECIYRGGDIFSRFMRTFMTIVHLRTKISPNPPTDWSTLSKFPWVLDDFDRSTRCLFIVIQVFSNFNTHDFICDPDSNNDNSV